MYPALSITTLIRRLSLLLVFVLGTLIGCAKDEAQTESSTPAPAAAAEPQALSSNIDKMQGKWQSQDDEAAVIEIKGDQFISWYNNEKMSSETLNFVSNSDEQAADPEGEYFVVMDESDALCYHLSHVDEALLEYSYVARGNTLSYTKIE